MGTYYYAVNHKDKKYFLAGKNYVPASQSDCFPGMFAMVNQFSNEYEIHSDIYCESWLTEYEDVTEQIRQQWIKEGNQLNTNDLVHSLLAERGYNLLDILNALMTNHFQEHIKALTRLGIEQAAKEIAETKMMETDHKMECIVAEKFNQLMQSNMVLRNSDELSRMVVASLNDHTALLRKVFNQKKAKFNDFLVKLSTTFDRFLEGKVDVTLMKKEMQDLLEYDLDR